MNRTDRLLAILLELQGRRRTKSEHLAQQFDVSKRTIYRDIQALNEAGVPVVSAPGQGYWLMEGYFLPPLSFNADEAMLLLLGADYMQQHFDTHLQEAARSALKKIGAVLKEDLRQEVNYLQENIRFFGPRTSVEHLESLKKLRRAVIECKRVTFHYVKRYGPNKDQVEHREVDPHGLFHLGGNWLVFAYCHLRQAMRMFRLDRMQDLIVWDTRFERQKGDKAKPTNYKDGLTQRVNLLFDASVARWVKENPPFFVSKMEASAVGLEVELRVRSLDEVHAWILSWGAKVEVMQPKDLRERLASEARQLLTRYNTQSG